MFTGDAIKEIAKIALERGTGARVHRAVVEEVLEGVLFDVEPGIRFVLTDRSVRGGEVVKHIFGVNLQLVHYPCPLSPKEFWKI